METIEILSLPLLKFAHIYSTERYTNTLAAEENFLEISYVSEGELCFHREEQEPLVAHKGDVICLRYDRTAAPFSEQFHCHHTVSAHAQWSPAAKSSSGLFLPMITPAHLVPQKVYEIIDDFIHRLPFYLESGTHSGARFLELLCAIDRCNRKHDGDLPGEVRYTRRAKDFIQQHIHSPISQGTVAEHLAITPEYLCAVFKKTEGVSLMKYINSIKLQAIRAIMEKENIRLYEASALYGYADPNYVSRLFKQYYGYPITAKPKVQE